MFEFALGHRLVNSPIRNVYASRGIATICQTTVTINRQVQLGNDTYALDGAARRVDSSSKAELEFVRR